MKFMKLGSKPDFFQTDGNNIRYAASDLATDVVIRVGDVKFYLHKFPLLSKSSHLQRLVSSANGDNGDEIDIDEIPGGPSAFELCAKFCYGMMVTLNAYNVVAARCASEYLEMYETMEKGNLVYKIDIFLSSSIFRSWKDSIIVLQAAKAFAPLSEELDLITQSVDAIAAKASVDVSQVDWSYTYNQKRLGEEDGGDPGWTSVRSRKVPKDWWVEDLCDLEIDLYKRVMIAIKKRGSMANDVIGKALKAYAYRRFPSSGTNVIPDHEMFKLRVVLDAIIRLLPGERGSVSCSFLLKMLKAAILAECGETVKTELVKKIGQQLDEARVDDLLIPSSAENSTVTYDVDVVKKIIEEFMAQDHHNAAEKHKESNGDIQETKSSVSEASKVMVANLVDAYLAEIAKDPNLPVASFIAVAETVSTVSRPVHDGLYRAIDTYLKVHHALISKSERKRICRFMDTKKLSAEACVHAVQNERLPLRVVVQLLFFEQLRAAGSPGSTTLDLPKALNCGSCGSSRSTTTNADEDWDAVASAEELRALRGEIAALRVSNGGSNGGGYRSNNGDKGKAKGVVSRRILSRVWSSKRGQQAENARSDSSGSLGEETKSGRHSVS